MAYHSTSGTAANTADMLVKLKDFLVTTCGWSMHDDGSALAQPYYVFKSNGESGCEDIYLQFINDNNVDMISVHGMLYWNAATHVAVKEAFSSAATCFTTKDSAAFLYWLYADLDHVYIVTKITATYYGHYSGIIKRYWSGVFATTLAAANAGSNVTVQVSDASIFAVGSRYIIKDNANIERVLVSARDTASSPNTITLATLVSSYGVGAKIGEDPQPVIVGRNSMPGQFYAVNKFDGWASATTNTGNCASITSTFVGYADPDYRYGLCAMFPWLAFMIGSAFEELRGELIEVYCIGPGAGDSEDVLDMGNGTTYKIFYLSTAGWCAIKE